jgi:hypothetical protein
MKEQIKLLINVNYYWMMNGKHTKIFDFGYGQQSLGKYSINIGEFKINVNQPTSSPINKSCENNISKNKDLKIMVQ